MKPFNNFHSHSEILENYDNNNHTYWNNTTPNFVAFRKDVRDHLVKQQNYQCPYCTLRIPSESYRHWDIDHVIAKSLNPSFLFEALNLALACPDCNKAKLDTNVYYRPAVHKLIHYPKNKEKFTIYHPFLDCGEYDLHILKIPIANKELFVYHGITAKGQDTIKICDLNRFINMISDWDKISIVEKELIDKPPSEFKKALEREQQKNKRLKIINKNQQKTINELSEI